MQRLLVARRDQQQVQARYVPRVTRLAQEILDTFFLRDATASRVQRVVLWTSSKQLKMLLCPLQLRPEQFVILVQSQRADKTSGPRYCPCPDANRSANGDGPRALALWLHGKSELCVV